MEKLFPRFLAQGPIEPVHYRFFLVLNYCSVFGVVAHVSFIPLFAWLGAGAMAGFNVASSVVWASALVLNRHGSHLLALGLVIAEVLVHAILAVIELGWGSGFQYYLLLLPLVIYLSSHPLRVKNTMLGAVALTLVSLQFMGGILPPHHIVAVDVATLLSIGNLAATFVVLAALTYYYHQIVARAETALQRTNDELARLASTDPLTGLLNRRKMVEELQNEFERFTRGYQPFSILLADIDSFKELNDRLGHEAGDHVLRQMATLLGEHTRQIDRVARWGGEEFLILLPQTDRAGALRVAEKLRQSVSNRAFIYNSESLSPTLTIGVAACSAGESIDRCILRADHAMYRGKQQGRNRVISA